VSVSTNTNFPNANLKMEESSGTAMYVKTGASALENAGSTTPVGDIAFNNHEDFLHFPFNFNDSYSDTWGGIFTMSSFTYTRSGTTTVTYDGYGTLKTPKGTFNNVVRIHFFQDYSDVSSMGTLTYKNDQYMWYVNGFHNPLGSVISLTVNGNPAQNAYYTDNANPLTGLSNNNLRETSVYPNPANDQLFVSGGEEVARHLTIFNPEGRLVTSADFQPGEECMIETGSLPAGIYMVHIFTGEGNVSTFKAAITH
jgi:hypothetical protein